MSKIVSFLVAMTVAYNLGTSITYGDTMVNTKTEISTQVDLESLVENIDNLDIDSLDEETRQALVNKLVSDNSEGELLIELAELEAGLTPNDFLYFLDKLMEDIRVSLAFTPENKAKILVEIALERMAEFNSLEAEDKVKYAENLIGDYIDVVAQATEAVEQEQEENPDADVTDIISVIEQVIQDGTNIITPRELSEEVVEKVSEQLQQAKEIVINTKSVAGIDKEIVTKLREQGLGYGEIKLISKIASESQKTIDQVMSVYLETKGIGKTMKVIGINPSQLNAKIRKDKVERVEEATKETEETTVLEVIDTTGEVNVEYLNANINEYEVQINKVQDENNEVKKQAEASKKVEEKKSDTSAKLDEKKNEAAKKADEKKSESNKKIKDIKENKGNGKDGRE